MEFLVPELRRENRDERLALARRGRAAGAAAIHETGDRARLENPRCPELLGLEERVDVFWPVRGEERWYVGSAIGLLWTLSDDRGHDLR